MRLSLVGMSGSGKSFWSRKLSRSGFRRICCDDFIAARLAAELGTQGGSIAAVGRWMGFPFERHYKEREASYLASEVEVMAQILGELSQNAENQEEDTVVDTTGSVIYTGEETFIAASRLYHRRAPRDPLRNPEGDAPDLPEVPPAGPLARNVFKETGGNQ